MPFKIGYPFMVGRTFSHYRVIEKIGEGGMGVVYRARDEQLDRDVAVKLLPTGMLVAEPARKRFRKEALALAKLNHPNIETVFEFGDQDGVDFLVTEYIPGLTLSDKLTSGPLSEKEIARLGTQLAEGLAAAHEQGVVHRDLKPANLRVTPDGRLKVLDFGLAKLLPVSAEQGLTASLGETHTAAGTLPYMSPEQLNGEPLDIRTDIYAAGAVLYEMATGQRAFCEELPSRLTDAILHRPPVTPRAKNGRISPELERITLKCLEKEPENRYQSAKELEVDLRRLTAPSTSPAVRTPAATWASFRTVGLVATGVAVLAGLLVGLNVGGWRDRLFSRARPPRIESLAVLPLINLSGDPKQDYFADGMTEQLTTDLAQIGQLRVISRTSAMQYKQTKKTLPEIARELNVDGVLEGSVERAGDHVRITAQLIRARNDTHLWAKSYESDVSNILALQDEMARTIAKEIEVRLTPQENNRLSGARRVNPEAHEAYLKARYYLNKSTEKDIATSIDYFKQAQRIDPSYAAAYAGMADAYTASGDLYWSPAETMPKAKAAAQKALELDETLAEAHTSLAAVQFYYDLDWPGTEKEIKRALELNQSYADAYDLYGTYFAALGQYEDAIAQGKRAKELDPLSLPINKDLGWSFLMARQYDEAIAQYQKTLEIEPNFAAAHAELGQVYAAKQEFAKAIAEVDRASQLEDTPFVTMVRADVYAVSGKRNKAEKLLKELKQTSKRRYVCPYELASVYVGLSENDTALDLYQKAHREGSMCIVWLKADPPWNSRLRSDPRFAALLHRIGLPP